MGPTGTNILKGIGFLAAAVPVGMMAMTAGPVLAGMAAVGAGVIGMTAGETLAKDDYRETMLVGGGAIAGLAVGMAMFNPVGVGAILAVAAAGAIVGAITGGLSNGLLNAVLDLPSKLFGGGKNSGQPDSPEQDYQPDLAQQRAQEQERYQDQSRVSSVDIDSPSATPSMGAGFDRQR